MTSAALSIRLVCERKRQQNLASIRETFESVGICNLTDDDIDRMARAAWYFVVQWGDSTPENWIKAIRLVLDICGVEDD